MYYHFKIHKEPNGYWAECVELDGCQTQGDTLAELTHNMSEALNLYLDEPESSKIVFPLPFDNVPGKNIAHVSVEPKIALAMQLRQARKKRHMSQTEAAQKIFGSKNVSTYQKLEKSKTANPELTTLVKIKRVFPEISIDDLLVCEEEKRA